MENRMLEQPARGPLTVMFVSLLIGLGVSSCTPGQGGPDTRCDAQSEAELCAQQEARCGTLSVVDDCGKARNITCGGCTGSLTCGGGGVANVCGASCAVSCPNGYTCNGQGICAGGNPARVDLDVRPVTVSGRVTLNGAVPLRTACYDYSATVTLTEMTLGSSATALIPCGSADFAFSLQVTPGTYRVSVSKYRPESTNLPDGTFVAIPQLTVTGPTSNVLADLRPVTVSGKVTLNGAPPVPMSCIDYLAVVALDSPETPVVPSFEDLLAPPAGSSAHSNIPCGAGFSWSASVVPGIYRLSVRPYRENSSNLPPGTFTVVQRISVP